MTRLSYVHAFAALAVGLIMITSANAASVSYHDFGATTGQESTGNITTHQSGGSTTSNNTLDTDVKELVRYSDGAVTGIYFKVDGAIAMDSRNSGQTSPPDAATPADPLFNVAGLNLNNGMIFEQNGVMTYTLTELNPSATYDLAFYGNRNASADGAERFTLVSAGFATNSSSAGVVDAFTTDQDTRSNQATGNVVRWTSIQPGFDGTIRVTVDPTVDDAANLAYLNALRIEQAGGNERLSVDIGRTDQAQLQDGWQEWNFSGTSGVLNSSESFAYANATDGSLEATITTTTSGQGRNYGLDFVTDPGNLTKPDVWSDQVFFNNNAGGSMTLTLDDLEAGTYLFRSFHYADDLSDGVSNNDEGTASVFVNNVDTGLDVTFVSGQNSTVAGSIEAADLDALGTLMMTFVVANDNDPVVIRFDNLTGGDTFGINGFQLVQVPAPAALPAGLALLGMTAMRRRRTA